MPLGYDVNAPRSIESPALFKLALRFSECPSLQELAGDVPAETALSAISICSPLEPWDPNGKITRDQLLTDLLRVQIGHADDADFSATHKVGDPEGAAPDVQGRFFVGIYRAVTDTELETWGLSGCYLGFADKIAAICCELHARADEIGAPFIRAANRKGAPKWQASDAESAQGKRLWALLDVDWGDRSGRGEA